jgi:hypothetical protein
MRYMQVIRIEKLETPEHDGDWHDKPLRWIVNGPRKEGQKFSTKKDATLYAAIRRDSGDQQEAINRFVRQSLATA